MKNLLSLLFLALILSACTKPITREEPFSPNEIVSLGFHTLSNAALNFAPYYDKSTLIFEDSEGVEYEFTMVQPVLSDAYSYTKTFPHPERFGEFVEYKYGGDRAFFEFISYELGAKFLVMLELDLCTDPRLDDDARPQSYLNIRGVGFNHGDVQVTTPALSVETSLNRPCGNGRRLGNITLGGRDFTAVTYHRQELDDRYFEVYYSPHEGVVAVGTTYTFLVLKEAY